MSIDFDDYVDSYGKLLNASLRLSGENDAYFDIYKINCLKRWIHNPNHRTSILDFGCGLGKFTNLMAKAYPQSIVYGFDVSSKSIEFARGERGHLNNVVFESRFPDSDIYDLITVVNVFHHVMRKNRRDTLCRLQKILKPGGNIAVFEHNPVNPLTLYTVKTCPFDADADLITLGQFVKLAMSCGLEVRMKRYIIFFPNFLKPFRRLDRFLGSIPLGAQYMILLGCDSR